MLQITLEVVGKYGQCDHIWRNFAILANHFKTLANV